MNAVRTAAPQVTGSSSSTRSGGDLSDPTASSALGDALALQADTGSVGGGDPKGVGAGGLSGGGGRLPYLDRIQASFGRHDVGGVTAHQDQQASGAARELGASAYAMGNHVALTGGADLHTVAHEAAHVVQQQGGVQLKGGVGEAGDFYEQHADAVADKVVAGESAEGLLDQVGGAGVGGGQPAVQLKEDKLAATWSDVGKDEPEDVQRIRTGVQNIYIAARKKKTEARKKLSEDHAKGMLGEKEKKAYLQSQIEAKLAVRMNTAWKDSGKNVELGMSADGDKRQENLAKKVTDVVGKVDGPSVINGLKSTAQTAADKIYGTRDTLFNGKPDTIEGAKAVRTAISKEIDPYARHGVSDPVVEKYESGYLESGMSLADLKQEWLEYAKQQKVGKKPVALQFEEMKDVVDLTLYYGAEFEGEVTLGTVYLNDARFVKSSEVVLPSKEVREVFKHRESGKEYVQDVADVFVPRIVSRALNEYDNPSDNSGVSIKADGRSRKQDNKPWKDVATDMLTASPKERDEEVFKHQRQKEAQGGSPFVSMTTTKHPIFGSTGKLFEGKDGVATIDLAQISKSKVIDTHDPKAYKRISGVDEPDPTMEFAQTPEFEKNVAARDAMRTRELVITGDVPDEAITGVSQKDGKNRINYVKDNGKFKKPPPPTTI